MRDLQHQGIASFIETFSSLYRNFFLPLLKLFPPFLSILKNFSLHFIETYFIIKFQLKLERGEGMVRHNTKNIVVNLDTSIKKSNEISLAKLNQGLTLNQMQVLAYAIFSTQKNGSTTFNKADFEKQFNIVKYATKDAVIDAKELMNLKVAFIDYVNDRFRYSNIFTDMYYERGTFVFEWNTKFLPHILDLKNRYIINDLTVTANFKSSFSWVLYEHLKALYGYWHKQFTKDELMGLFNVEEVKSYQTNTSLFKTKVLDVAIEEINQYTELEISYTEMKKGRAIVGFDLHWSTGKFETAASEKLITEIRSIVEAVSIDASKLIMISDDQARMEAVRVFNLIMTKAKELTESSTQDQAQNIYDYIKIRMNELNKILIDTQTEIDEKSIFYNWLDERE